MNCTFRQDEPRADGEARQETKRVVMDAVEFARKRLRFEPDEQQCEVLLADAKRGILNCTRQWGKSTIAAAKAVHRAYTQEKSVVLVASPSQRQSAELVQKAREMVASLGITPRGDGHNKNSVLLPNGSRIIGLPGKEATVRGFSAVSLVLIDEASRVDDALYKALRPMLAIGNGDMWLMSTPYGKRGFFYECWEHERADWFRVTVTGPDCPRISAEFLEDERRGIGPVWFAQEYLGEFVENGVSVFGRDLVDRAVDESFGPLRV
jgi:hypothetical protein